MNKLLWQVVDHACRICGGRILQNHGEQTVNGLPLYQCADCGESATGKTPSDLCWCGFHMRGEEERSGFFMCLPYSILHDKPFLRAAFLQAGCNPDSRRSAIGKVSRSAYETAILAHDSTATKTTAVPIMPKRAISRVKRTKVIWN